jgi:UDP-glucose 4-epimerase
MTTPLSRALVTGGAGFIGSHLVDTLLAEGCEVSVLDNLSTGKRENLDPVADRIRFYPGDIRDPEVVETAMAECEAVFHQAALVSVPQSVEAPLDSAAINDLGTLNVLEAARKGGVRRVVLASSSAVYGDLPGLPKREEMELKPMSPYALHKLTGELNARLYTDLYGLEAVCLRYFNVFGPRQDPSSPYSGVISIFMTMAADNRTPVIYGDGEQYRDFIYVADVVRANLLSATVDGAAGSVLNIGTGATVTINRLWETIRKMAGCDLAPEYGPPRIGDIVASSADIGKAETRLGFRPSHSFTQGLETTFNWYMENR